MAIKSTNSLQNFIKKTIETKADWAYSQSLTRTYQEFDKFKPLSQQETTEIFTAMHYAKNKGDENGYIKFRNRLVNHNLRLVKLNANKLSHRGNTLQKEDLISAGVEGLLVAIDKFDHEKKSKTGKPVKFKSYAGTGIILAIMAFVSEHENVVRIPSFNKDNKFKIEKAKQKLSQIYEQNADSLSSQIIGEYIDIDENDISFTNEKMQESVSIYDASNDYDLRIVDTIVNKNVRLPEDIAQDIDLEIFEQISENIMSKKRFDIFCEYYGIGKDYPISVGNIAEKHNEKVRNIQFQILSAQKALKKLFEDNSEKKIEMLIKDNFAISLDRS